MGFQFLTRETMPNFVERLDRLSADSKREWGELSLEMMLAHCTRGIEISMREYEAKDESTWFTKTFLRWFAFHAPVPWPKGKIKTLDSFLPAAEGVGDFETEREKLKAAMRRFVETVENEPNREGFSPYFGSRPLKYFERVQGKHLDHHLRQYGA